MSEVIERKTRAMQPQPLDIINVPGAWLNIRTVEILVGFKKTKINEEIKAGRFPAGRTISQTCTRWLSDDILAYLDSRRSCSNFYSNSPREVSHA